MKSVFLFGPFGHFGSIRVFERIALGPKFGSFGPLGISESGALGPKFGPAKEGLLSLGAGEERRHV